MYCLDFLKKLVEEEDMREMIKETFFFHKYTKNNKDGRKILMDEYSDDYDERDLR